ncbi:glutathione S-transferase [Mycena olivaceomarginata]|nr:glutathione S-transferase [Mycena olivaceomarginata]
MSSTKDLLLFDHPVSSYAQKIRIALREKNLPFRSEIPVGGGIKPSLEFVETNPRREVPVLINGSDAIFDSTIILEYLEDLHPSPPLLPPASDPGARARVRMIEDVADTIYEAVNWVWGEVLWSARAGDDEEGNLLRKHIATQVRDQTEQLYAWFEDKLGEHDFFGGSHGFGYADLALIALVHRSIYYGFPPANGSKLMAWYDRCAARESVRVTLREVDENVAELFKLKGFYRDGSGFRRQYRDHRMEAMVKLGGWEILRDGIRDENVKFSWPGQLGKQLGKL